MTALEGGVTALALAERALAAAAGEMLVTVTHERWLMLRFARSRSTQATSVDDVTVQFAAVRDGYVGRASTNRTDDDCLLRCGRRAAEGARCAAQRPSGAAAASGRPAAQTGGFPGFPAPAGASDPAGVGAPSGYDPETAELDPAAGGAALQAAFAVGHAAQVEVGGIWTAGDVETAIATSGGLRLSDRVTDAYMKVVATAPDGRTGYASSTAVSGAAINPVAVAERAAGKATAGSRPAAGTVGPRIGGAGSRPALGATAGAPPVALAPGAYTVVLAPPAVAELLWVLARAAFNGVVHADGRGALSSKLGTRVAAPAVSLSDSTQAPGALPRAFDAEGVRKRPLALIEDGIARAVAHDTRSAARAGTRSTGHALVAGGSAQGPHPTNLVLHGGTTADEAALCGQVQRGVYVTRLWYTNIVRRGGSAFTAVTRDGTFLIDGGRLGAPVADVRVTDTALGILARTRALGAEPELCSEDFYGRRFAVGSLCPPLLADGVRFTGGA